MDAAQLRNLQAPLKTQYQHHPETAVVTMRASGEVQLDSLACNVKTHAGNVVAGLHPAAGGDGNLACSGDMLLEALVACSGVTLAAVATAMGIELRRATVTAEATMDFRGTLGVEKSVPVGLQKVELRFDLQSSAEDSQLAKLVQLAERYCVVLQSLRNPAALSCRWTRS